VRWLWLSLLITCSAASASDRARESVQRSLPYLEKNGVAWIAERGCVSCHQTSFLIWTHREAHARGLKVDVNKLEAWTNWGLLNVLAAQQNGTRQGAETLSQLLLGRNPGSMAATKPTSGTRTAEPYESIAKDLLAAQAPEGNWPVGGQSKYPPDVSTGWALYALALRDPALKTAGSAIPDLEQLIKANDEAVSKASDRAQAWLANVKEDAATDLTEQLVVRLLAETRRAQPERIKQRVMDLLSRQNADGGWSVDPKLRQPSDAFATGMALYALTRAGSEDLAEARGFLLQTQQADGSWRISTTSFHPLTGKPRDARTDAVYTYWGTAWATLGLLQTIQP
jgi:hypothetical protein